MKSSTRHAEKLPDALDLGQFLAQQAADGELDSDGHITVSHEKALRKLSRFSLPFEHAWVLKVVQASVAWGCPRLEVRRFRAFTSFELQPRAVPEQERIVNALLSPTLDDDSPVEMLTKGLRALVEQGGLSFRLLSRSQGEAQRPIHAGPGASLLERLAAERQPEEDGLQLLVLHLPLAHTALARFLPMPVLKERPDLRIGEALWEHAFLSPIPILLDGKRIDDLLDHPRWGFSSSARPVVVCGLNGQATTFSLRTHPRRARRGFARPTASGGTDPVAGAQAVNGVEALASAQGVGGTNPVAGAGVVGTAEAVGVVEAMSGTDPAAAAEVVGTAEAVAGAEAMSGTDPVDRTEAVGVAEAVGVVEAVAGAEAMSGTDPVAAAEVVGTAKAAGVVEAVAGAEAMTGIDPVASAEVVGTAEAVAGAEAMSGTDPVDGAEAVGVAEAGKMTFAHSRQDARSRARPADLAGWCLLSAFQPDDTAGWETQLSRREPPPRQWIYLVRHGVIVHRISAELSTRQSELLVVVDANRFPTDLSGLSPRLGEEERGQIRKLLARAADLLSALASSTSFTRQDLDDESGSDLLILRRADQALEKAQSLLPSASVSIHEGLAGLLSLGQRWLCKEQEPPDVSTEIASDWEAILRQDLVGLATLEIAALKDREWGTPSEDAPRRP